jgi:hypothetical protein
MEIDNFLLPPTVEFEAIHRVSYNDTPYTIKNVDIQHQMIDKMIFPEVLLHSRPCSFSSQQVYNITRQYVLQTLTRLLQKLQVITIFVSQLKKLFRLLFQNIFHNKNIFAMN